ncbi:SCO3374 family protein [Streptomyces cyaneus]|uniref:SCO3374 family protein n=1 Tax=Streptomyces cyaneus TaxID=1904 RepID=UPI000FF8793C|nr:SCO3374 family protein [Streptomyces cyaneus]
MVGTRSAVTTDFATIPLPRRPLDPSDQVRRWYENELGWPVVPATPGIPLSLRVGLRFDVLDVPAEAGRAALRHLTPHSPVAVRGERMRLLMSAGSAEEVPGVLDWLEWGTLPLDLTTLGEGDLMEAPLPPEQGPVMTVRPLDTRFDTRSKQAVRRPCVPEPGAVRPLPLSRSDAVQGAAVWLRPPEPGGEVEASLPTLSAMGGGGGAPDLVRLLNTVATQCHRLRLRRGCAQSSACP